MSNKLYIPNKIKVGFQNRSDTYTGKLAYVIYYDETGKLRKENSWNNWRNKDIEPQEFDNIPIEGFVLNKKVGDYCSNWNHRQAYVRVYDPRGFEFEITVQNLLFILENCSSIKGKGLDGEFIYSWDGKDLVLLPKSCPDYIKISNFTQIVNNNNFIKTKDLQEGYEYINKNNIKYVYLGKHDYFNYEGEQKGKKYFFAVERNWSWGDEFYIDTFKNPSKKFISKSEFPCEKYSECIDKLNHDYEYSPVIVTQFVPLTEELLDNDKCEHCNCHISISNKEYTISRQKNNVYRISIYYSSWMYIKESFPEYIQQYLYKIENFTCDFITLENLLKLKPTIKVRSHRNGNIYNIGEKI